MKENELLPIIMENGYKRLVTKGIKCFPIVYLKIQLLQRFSLNPILPFHKFLLIVFQIFLDVFGKFCLVSKVSNFQECPMYEKCTPKSS